MSDLKREKKTEKEDITSLNINGTLIQNQQTIANFFNNYFATVAEKLIKSNHMDKKTQILPNSRHSYPNIKFRYTSTKEIEETIKSLKTKNAQGYHEIPVKILKWSAPFISSPLTYICSKSLETGFFPSRLKYSTVRPIFKAGDKFDIANFRPISLLISFSKIF